MIQEQAISAEERRRVATEIARDCGWPSLEAMRRTNLKIPRFGGAVRVKAPHGWTDRVFTWEAK